MERSLRERSKEYVKNTLRGFAAGVAFAVPVRKVLGRFDPDVSKRPLMLDDVLDPLIAAPMAQAFHRLFVKRGYDPKTARKLSLLVVGGGRLIYEILEHEYGTFSFSAPTWGGTVKDMAVVMVAAAASLYGMDGIKRFREWLKRRLREK
ncbi:MAG: hypothetical protein GXO00_03145 [Candidatus Diapherotrites archaeon]|nr:hypothetical protein [Candidatus Diapherotrites archaeon]